MWNPNVEAFVNYFETFVSELFIVMYTLLIDNHDSFSYNIFHLLKSVDDGQVRIVEVEKVVKSDVLSARRVILSPGPGLPTQLPNLMESIYWAERTCPLLGICLGHQAIAIHFGGSLRHLTKPYHGMQSCLKIKERSLLFENMDKVSVARYHSWVVDRTFFPKQLKITSLSEQGHIMSFQHKKLPIWGVQFHPESFVTTNGKQMIGNFFKL